MVVYGHTPVPEPEWLNRTVNIDTGCVFGGKLTALRYPEKEFVSVPAARTYCEPARPFLPEEQQAPAFTAQQAHDEVLDAEDVLGKRIVPTRLRGNVTIREENADAALEVMSRFAADPRWLIYLPPTCRRARPAASRGCWSTRPRRSPTTAARVSPRVICEEKHMGSRAVVVVCRDEQAAQGAVRRRRRRGSASSTPAPAGGSSTTRDLERQFLDRVRDAVTARTLGGAGDDWACLDCELMPWSAKAQELLRTQYAAVGRPGLASLPRAVAALEQAASALDGEERARCSNRITAAGSEDVRRGSSPPTGSIAGRSSRSTT